MIKLFLFLYFFSLSFLHFSPPTSSFSSSFSTALKSPCSSLPISPMPLYQQLPSLRLLTQTLLLSTLPSILAFLPTSSFLSWVALSISAWDTPESTNAFSIALELGPQPSRQRWSSVGALHSMIVTPWTSTETHSNVHRLAVYTTTSYVHQSPGV